MGLFDKVFGAKVPDQAQPLSQQEAFAGIALAASASDGHIADVEIRSMASYLNRMNLYQGYSTDQLVRVFDKLLGILKRDGVSKLVDESKDILPQELKETAFALAVDVTLADGILEPSEKALLNHLYQSLGIDEALAVKVIEVMIIKNRG